MDPPRMNQAYLQEALYLWHNWNKAQPIRPVFSSYTQEKQEKASTTILVPNKREKVNPIWQTSVHPQRLVDWDHLE